MLPRVGRRPLVGVAALLAVSVTVAAVAVASSSTARIAVAPKAAAPPPVSLDVPGGGVPPASAPRPATTLPPLARRPVSSSAAAAAARSAAVPVPSTAAAPVVACPLAAYTPPDPARPRVTLAFDLAADHRTVTGTESVTFTPDLPVRELVFRLWPNGPEGGRQNASLTVTSAVNTSAGSSSTGTGSTGTAPGTTTFRTESAGGRPGTQGTLLTIPLGRTASAGETLHADLSFTLHLPNATWDRLGTDGRTSYWGSGHPMLAWESGVGWDRDPASPLPGETASSEAADVSLSVSAPAADTVLGPGTGQPPTAAGAGRRMWRFSAGTARDVAVVAGPLATSSTRLQVAGRSVDVVAGVAAGVHMSPATLLREARRALPALAARFGPVPVDVVRVVAVPGVVASGIEYPGMALVLPQPSDASTRVVETHELAHQWFYALVGNDQARDPWLDEAFATYAESLVNGDGAAYRRSGSGIRVGAPMTFFGTDYDRYQRSVYDAGATALLDARVAAGAPAFDAAVRCYVRRAAWRIATPSMFAAQLQHLPEATAVLRRVRAF